MPFRSLLMRVLLCLAIAFNGVSAAHAGLHLEHGQRSETIQSARVLPSDARDAMACHGAEQGGGDGRGASPAHDLADDEPDAPRCCKGVCQCACMQHATPAGSAASAAVVIEHLAAQPRRVTAHAPPAVVRLNRPPIG